MGTSRRTLLQGVGWFGVLKLLEMCRQRMSISVCISDSQSAETWPALCPLFWGKGMTLTDQNYIHEEMKRRLNSVQKFFVFSTSV
jgi:hypothetical protein